MKEFDLLNTDYLEEDLQIKKDNTFLLVMDKNLKGPESVSNLLPQNCIIEWKCEFNNGKIN